MNTVAPVCPISRSQAVSGQPGRLTPIAFRATDLPSLIQAINAINAILQQMTLSPVTNNVYPPLSFGFPLQSNSPTVHGGGVVMGPPEWDEGNRITDIMEIYHQNDDGTVDKDQFIEVERIFQIMFDDRNSDDKFFWSYKL